MSDSLFPQTDQDATTGFQVSARKYRPQNFDQMIGQQVLVQTLRNAIKADRIAHAFIMTGERGTGKTSIARIIARALNCLAGDGPQLEPCGVCENCQAIAKSSHVDVLEIDAASRTGVDDMREVIDTVPYRPVQARYKVYIIDEVHMLSKSAFNALLKTLEEPPAHVKFIFATTEINKVPITVLSRCQRFDLRRVPAEQLQAHFAKICETENIGFEPQALALIARAADGSVRDGLSLLDQGFAQLDLAAGETLTAQAVQAMLGMADLAAVVDILSLLLTGQVSDALARFDALYQSGAQPKLVLRSMADVLHAMSRFAVDPGLAKADGLPEQIRGPVAALAQQLSLPLLMRAWQGISQGIADFALGGDAKQNADMVLIKLGFASQLPDPSALIERLKPSLQGTERPPSSAGSAGHSAAPQAALKVVAQQQTLASQPDTNVVQQAIPSPSSMEDLVKLCFAHKEPRLANALSEHVALVSLTGQNLVLRALRDEAQALPQRLMHCLQSWTGQPWSVTLTDDADVSSAASLGDQRRAKDMQREQDVLAHPDVRQVMTLFPGAKLHKIRSLKDTDT